MPFGLERHFAPPGTATASGRTGGRGRLGGSERPPKRPPHLDHTGLLVHSSTAAHWGPPSSIPSRRSASPGGTNAVNALKCARRRSHVGRTQLTRAGSGHPHPARPCRAAAARGCFAVQETSSYPTFISPISDHPVAS